MNNNNLMQTKRVNSLKTALILGGLFLLIMAFGFVLSSLTGNSNYITYAVFIAIASNFISYFFGGKIALSMSGATLADEDKYLDLHNMISDLALKYHLPKPKVYVINDPAPNAFATGRNQKNASVAFTTGILATLNRSELEGVAAHELTHVKNRDMLVMTVVVMMTGVLSMLANMAMQANLFGSRDKENSNGGILMIIGLVSSVLLPVAALIIQSSISRKREFMADAGAGMLTEHPEALASALRKISNFRQPLIRANTATAHLYIACPFGGNMSEQSFWQKLFLTHPPVEERISALLG